MYVNDFPKYTALGNVPKFTDDKTTSTKWQIIKNVTVHLKNWFTNTRLGLEENKTEITVSPKTN